jgi:hypothetical protein
MSLGGRNYAFANSFVLVASASLPFATVVSTAAVRPRLAEFQVGSSSTPANAAARYDFNRISTAGTAGSNPTPAPTDPADPAAVTINGLGTFSVAPTIGTLLFRVSVNQQNTYRWLAAPGRELIMPAIAANGLEFLTPVVTAAFTADFTFYFEE